MSLIDKLVKTVLPDLLKNGWLQHLSFWGCSYYILLNHFSISSEILPIDHIYTSLFHISLLIGVYIHLRAWVNLFLANRRYILYFLSLAFTLVMMLGLHNFTFSTLTQLIFPDYYLISYYSLYQLNQYFLIYLGISTLLHQSKSWFQLRESERLLMKSERVRVEAELSALKQQIHPHFLFNSLNSLYGLSLKNSRDLPDHILKLSDVIRYMLYEGTVDWIPLEKEIEYLENYLSLQSLRSDENRKVSWNRSGAIEGIRVPPLIFINLIENAFVHGGENNQKENFINILLKVSPHEIILEVRNSVRRMANELKKEGGVGLENLRRRLDILYPSSYHLNYSREGEHFVAKLILNINENTLSYR